MAWRCVRCEKKIYRPRPGAIKFAMTWTYKKKTKELNTTLVRLEQLGKSSVVTHLHCEHPEVEGFKDRMRVKLRMPPDSEHPLLI